MCYPLKTQAPISLLDETQEEKYRVIAVNSFWISRVHSDYHSHTGLSSGMAVHTLERGEELWTGMLSHWPRLAFLCGAFAICMSFEYMLLALHTRLILANEWQTIQFAFSHCLMLILMDWHCKRVFFSFAHLMLQTRTDHNLPEKNVNALKCFDSSKVIVVVVIYLFPPNDLRWNIP